MFVQVIQGRTSDAEGLKRQFERWMQEVQPGASGWLGSTAGVTDDGEFIGVARFESEDAARRNSDRPEQGEWWAETEKYFEGGVEFHDCTDVRSFLAGGSDDAGFVQIMQGRATDPERMKALGETFEKDLPERRPDLIGGFSAQHGDGTFTDINYFTSEADARAGERQEYPEEMRASFEEFMSLVPDIKWYDLKEPWLYSP